MSTTAVTFSGTTSLTATSGIWTLAGNFTQTNTPTFTHNSGTITITASSSVSAPAITFNKFIINASGGFVTCAVNTTMPLGADPSVAVSASGLTVTGTVSGTGTMAFTSGPLIMSASTGVLSGFTAVTLTNAGFSNNATATTPSGLNVTITLTGASGTTFTGAGKVYGTVTISGGTGQVTISGNNTFTTLNLARSTGATTPITGSNTIGTLQANAGTATHQILFTAGTTQTVTTMSVNGAATKLVTMRSDTLGTAWTLTTAAGAKTASYVVIQDSTVDASPTWTADSNSANGGGNTNWLGFAGGSSSSGAIGQSGKRVRQGGS